MTTQIPPLPIIDGHFFIDNSSLEHFTTCRRSYEYHDIHKRTLKAAKAGLLFGGLLHSCLEMRYRWEATTGLSPRDSRFDTEVEQKQFDFIKNFYRQPLPQEMEYRTEAYAQECILLYNKYYLSEPFTIARDSTGKPLVEVPFSLELGTIAGPDNKPVVVMWTGRIDLVAEWDRNVFMHGDHKSSKIGGDRFFDDYVLDQAQRGYAWALQRILGRTVGGFFVNGLICRPPTKTGKPFDFIRRKFTIDDPDTLVEWQENTLRLVEDIFHDYSREYFPMETKWCNGKYGACQYRDVCNVRRQGRRALLYGGLFQDNTWSPLNKPTTS